VIDSNLGSWLYLAPFLRCGDLLAKIRKFFYPLSYLLLLRRWFLWNLWKSFIDP